MACAKHHSARAFEIYTNSQRFSCRRFKAVWVLVMLLRFYVALKDCGMAVKRNKALFLPLFRGFLHRRQIAWKTIDANKREWRRRRSSLPLVLRKKYVRWEWNAMCGCSLEIESPNKTRNARPSFNMVMWDSAKPANKRRIGFCVLFWCWNCSNGKLSIDLYCFLILRQAVCQNKF